MGKVQVYQEPNRGEHLISKTGDVPDTDLRVLVPLFLDSKKSFALANITYFSSWQKHKCRFRNL